MTLPIRLPARRRPLSTQTSSSSSAPASSANHLQPATKSPDCLLSRIHVSGKQIAPYQKYSCLNVAKNRALRLLCNEQRVPVTGRLPLSHQPTASAARLSFRPHRFCYRLLSHLVHWVLVTSRQKLAHILRSYSRNLSSRLSLKIERHCDNFRHRANTDRKTQPAIILDSALSTSHTEGSHRNKQCRYQKSSVDRQHQNRSHPSVIGACGTQLEGELHRCQRITA